MSAPTLSAEDRLAVADALLRFAAGTDDGDAAMIGSAFAPDAVVDFGPCGRKLGLAFDKVAGREAVTGFLAGTAERQATTHVVSNARTQATTAGRATLRALVDAVHRLRSDPDRRFRMMNRYDAELVIAGEGWRIARLTIDNLWSEGDPWLLFER